jgi:teichuronic acid biosynthesis glycosyltransferase TuaG
VNIEVSVVIPCYNAEDCIRKCIESVLAQTFENFEILAIDDASLDGTISSLRSFDDKRLRIIELGENSGSPTVPRNIGIQKAQGAYIAFLDCDDFWHPDKLCNQLAYMKKNAYKLSCTDYIVSELDGSEHRKEAQVFASLRDLLRLNTVGCSTVVISKELISNFKFRDCPHEDYDMWLQILREQNGVYGLNEDLTTYVKRKNSRSRLSFRNFVGLHSLFKEYGQVGNIRAFIMILQYVREGRSHTAIGNIVTARLAPPA